MPSGRKRGKAGDGGRKVGTSVVSGACENAAAVRADDLELRVASLAGTCKYCTRKYHPARHGTVRRVAVRHCTKTPQDTVRVCGRCGADERACPYLDAASRGGVT